MSTTRFMCYIGCKTVQPMYEDVLMPDGDDPSLIVYTCPKCGMAYGKDLIDEYIEKNPMDGQLLIYGEAVAFARARYEAQKNIEAELDAVFKKAGEHLFAWWLEKHGYAKAVSVDTPNPTEQGTPARKAT